MALSLLPRPEPVGAELTLSLITMVEREPARKRTLFVLNGS